MKRGQTGTGQHLEVSQIGALLWLESMPAMAATVTGLDVRPETRSSAANPFFNFYRTADDRWLILGEWQAGRKLADLYQIIGRPDLMDDSNFNSFEGAMKNSA